MDARGRVEKRYWHNPQILRLIAAYSIVIVHLEPSFHVVFGASPVVVDAMKVSTDVFLVLSGFLATYLIQFSRTSAADGLWHRLARILPLYWIFTVFAFIFRNALMSERNHATTIELMQSLTMIPYGPFPVLSTTWSLTPIVEFGIILAISRAISRRFTTEIAFALTSVIVIIGVSYPPVTPAMTLYTSTVTADFAAGALLALGLPYVLKIPRRGLLISAVTLLMAGLTITFVATVSNGDEVAYRGVLRMQTLGLAAFCIVAAALLFELGGYVVRSLWVERLTRYAFCIYLCHFFWTMAVDKLVTVTSTSVSIFLFIITPVIVTILAAVSYSVLEAPIAQKMSRFPPWFREGPNARQLS